MNDIVETVMIKGDLGKLTADERTAYYFKMCEAIGVNPVTRPLEYIPLNGRLTLYARKDCTDQLRKKNGISVTDLTESEREGVYVVTAKVCNADGRTDISKGAVNIANLKGENLANAIMKAETKAKRRATLSICGLGMLDETEVEDIVANQPQTARERIANVAFSPDPAAAVDAMHEEWAERQAGNLANAVNTLPSQPQGPHAVPHLPEGDTAAKWAERYAKSIGLCASMDEFTQWVELNKANLDVCVKSRAATAYIGPAHTAARRRIKEAEASRPTSAHAAGTAEPASPAPASVSTSASPASTASSKPAAAIDNPEAFVKDMFLRIDQCGTPDAVDVIYQRDIWPHEGELLQPDVQALLQRMRHRKAALTP